MKGKKSKARKIRQGEEASKGKEKNVLLLIADPSNWLRRHWVIEGTTCFINEWMALGENETRRRSQGGLMLTCDGFGRSTNFKTMMARPRLQSLGHDAPPSDCLEMPTVDGAAAAFAHLALQLWVSPSYATSAWTTPLPPLLVETIRRTSEQPSAILRKRYSKRPNTLLQMSCPVLLFSPV